MKRNYAPNRFCNSRFNAYRKSSVEDIDLHWRINLYLFSISLTLTNEALLENKKIPNRLIIINGLTMLVSGSIIIYNLTLFNLCHFKSSRV